MTGAPSAVAGPDPGAAHQPAQSAELAPRRRRRRARTAAVGAAVAAAAAGGGGWWLVANAGATAVPAAPAVTGPPATATVTRQNLVATEQVDGTLGYGDEHVIAAARPGTLTWLPAEGATVSRGKALYRLDDQPVVLMYGGLPLYRELRPGDEGPDVQVLEQNLAALGYSGFTVDEEYTADTADAVRSWQQDLGLADTGTVEVGRVVVRPGPIRVSDVPVDTGTRTAPGQPVLGHTGTTRIVGVDLELADRPLARRGGAVTVVLPDGRRVRGTVRTVGTVAQTEQGAPPAGPVAGGGGAGGGSAAEDATIEVTVTLTDPKSAGGLDQGPVDVEFVSEQRAGVLTVPVAALLALREGGYGVEVVAGDGTRIVAVTLGMFANGRVEVTGTGLTAGMTVGVPPS